MSKMTAKINDKADSYLSLLCWAWGQIFLSSQKRSHISVALKEVFLNVRLFTSDYLLSDTCIKKGFLRSKENFLLKNTCTRELVISKWNCLYDYHLHEKKNRRNLKNLNKYCEKLGFSFVYEYVEIKNLKIFKKKKQRNIY